MKPAHEIVLSPVTLRLLELALQEDLGERGDITSAGIIPAEQQSCAHLLAKSPLVICGHPVGETLSRLVDPNLVYKFLIPEGERVDSGAKIAEVKGATRSLLLLERTLLNFFQRLSGVALTTADAVSAIAGTGVRLLDTRKTTPGLRQLEKYAVTVGGGVNHRFGLFDQVLIKNNHVDAVSGNVGVAVQRSRDFLSKEAFSGVKIEVEVRDLHELQQAIATKPDQIMLDNFSPALVVEAVKLVRAQLGSQVQIEVSGGISRDNLKEFALNGVDFISLGFLTHSIKSVDISFRIE